MPVKATKSGITRYWDNAQWDAMDGSHNGWTLIERIDVEKPEARRPFAEIAPPRVIPVGDPLYGVEGESPIVVTNDLGIATVGLIDGTVDGYVLTWNDSGGYWEEQAPPTGVPAGTDTQTLRYNGTTLEANSLLRNNGSQIGVNTAPASGILLKVKQASTGDGIAVERSSSAGQIRMYHGSAGTIDTTLNNLELRSAGQLNLYGAGGGGFITQVFVGAQANITSVFGNSGLMRFSGTYAPTTSGGDFAFMKFLPTVNQSGSADQDVFAIDLNPTLTSVLGTFTGVNYRPSAYRFLWQPNGAGVTSHLRGVLGIGDSTTSPAQTLHVNGTMRLTGSDGTATALMGRDADGDVSAVTVGSGLSLSGGELTATGSGVTGSGAANHIAYWTGTSAIAHDANQLYWNPTTNKMGIGTASPAAYLHIGVPTGTSDEGLRILGNLSANLNTTIWNVNNVNGGANTLVNLSVGGASGGDPALQLSVPGATTWSMGVDNSDSDKFKLKNASHPSGSPSNTGITITTGSASKVGINTDNPLYDLDAANTARARTLINYGDTGTTYAPTITPGPGMGTAPTGLFVFGGQNGFLYTFTTGTSPSANSRIFTVTPKVSFPTFIIPTISPGTTAATTDINKFRIANASSIQFEIHSVGTLSASTAYSLFVTIIGY